MKQQVHLILMRRLPKATMDQLVGQILLVLLTVQMVPLLPQFQLKKEEEGEEVLKEAVTTQ